MTEYPEKRKKRRLNKIRLDEVSGVDTPAQAGALAAIMKRDPYGDKELNKRAALTTSSDGHTHLVHLTFDGAEMNNGNTSSYWDGNEAHSHPWVRSEDGKVTIGKAGGHTHRLGTISKSIPEDVVKPTDSDGTTPVGKRDIMTEEEIQKQKDDLAKATARAEKAERLAELNDAQRAYHKSLEGEVADEFLSKSDEARQAQADAEVAKAAESNSVVYTADNGDEFRKNDDPRLVKMAKERDLEKAETKRIRDEAEATAFRKRAQDELPNTSGDEEAKVSLLKAVSAIQDKDQREAVEAILKGADAAFEFLTKSQGHQGASTSGDAEDQLDNYAKSIAEKDGIDFSQAMTKALTTDEGKALYAKARAEAPV